MENNSNKIAGVLLCGGKSSRMGTDKGLLSVNGKKWFERNHDLLSKIFSNVYVSINPNQYEEYIKINSNMNCVVDSVNFLEGPLVGILSVHKKNPEFDLFVLACDLIRMEDNVILKVLKSYEENPGYNFYTFQNKFFIETLCSIYTSNGLREILNSYISNEIRNFSIQKILSNSNTYIQPVDTGMMESFENFNTPLELENMK